MVLDWKAEEKTLLNMKKIIVSVWRMNRQQLYSYCRRMQKKQPEILPGVGPQRRRQRVRQTIQEAH